MMVCLPRDKYAGKSRAGQFFHRYTGIILVLVAAVVIAGSWFWFDLQRDDFETWTCPQIIDEENIPYVHRLNEEQRFRYFEIMEECYKTEEFLPRPALGQ